MQRTNWSDRSIAARGIAGAIALSLVIVAACGPDAEHPEAERPRAKVETMAYDIELKDVEPQATLSVRGPTKIEEISAAIGERTQVVWQHLQESGAALDRWLAENDREARGPNWEVYRVNAGTASDPSEYETDVFKPIR